MTIQDYLEQENKLPQLDNVEVNGVPVWRIVRTKFRWEMISGRPFTVGKNFQLGVQLRNNHRSFVGLTRLMLSRKKISTIFFPHPRLYLVDGQYVERMSDPLIDYSAIREDYLILERHQNGLHREPRIHSDHVVFMDFIDNVSRTINPFTKILYKRKYGKAAKHLITILETEYQFDHAKMRGVFIDTLSFFFAQKAMISPVLRHLAPKQVFVAPRQTYQYVIANCKQLGIRTIELQHGVTVGETELYSGSYYGRIDPDYFCVFGKANVGPQFGIPIEKVVNTGFPYKNYVQSLGLQKFGPQVILVISEPEISTKVVDLLTSFVDYHPDFIFHIRCHPQEKFSAELVERIKGYKQIMVVDNTLESFCALSQYECVIGENSTVMYEAMSMGKKVGRLNYGGFCVKETDLIHGGTKINSHDELIKFVEYPYSDEQDSKDVYSDFDEHALNSILN